MALVDRLRELVSDSCGIPSIIVSLSSDDTATWVNGTSYSIKVTSVTRFGETLPCSAVTVVGVTKKSFSIAITRVDEAEFYRVYVGNVLAGVASQSQLDTITIVLTDPPVSGSAVPSTDTAGVYLSTTAYDNCVTSAIREYSSRRPLTVSEDITVETEGQEQALPDDWVSGFSTIKNVEYPIDQIPPVYLNDQEDYNVKDDKIYFDFDLFVDDEYRVYYTIDIEESTVPTIDLEAVALLAASKACTMIAVNYTHLRNKAIGADAVNYAERSTGFTGLSKEFRRQFDELIPDTGGASAVVSYYPDHGVM